MGCFNQTAAGRFLWGAIALISAGPIGPVFAAQAKEEPQLVYEQLCAGCHGTRLEGGKGGALLGPLRHGDDASALSQAIRVGFPDAGMPPVGGQLAEADINTLVVYLLEKRANTALPPPVAPPDPREIRQSEKHRYRIEYVVKEGLEVPWSFAWLPDGRILLTERAGRLRVIENGQLRPQPIVGVPPVIEKGEGGLMSVTVDPDYPKNGWIYLSFSDAGEGGRAMTKIVRGKLHGDVLDGIETLFALPRDQYQEGYVHFGSRLAFDQGYLYFTIGERGRTGDAQKLELPNGKIHRVFPDGSVPPDNPFAGRPGAVGSIWSYGHRNPQGLAIHPVTHAIWETEHGPRGGDELNHIEKGLNYGWPLITYGINYDGTPVSDRTEAPGLEQPKRHWTPSIATSEIAFYTGDKFPGWKDNLFLGSLAQQKFIRFELDGPNIVHEEEIFSGLGRVRDIKTGPDGLLYLALEQIGNRSGWLVRLVPADQP
jgi:aldose sugar dehydrogenase